MEHGKTTKRVGAVEHGCNDENPGVAEVGFGNVARDVADDEGEAGVEEERRGYLMPLKRMSGSIRRSSRERRRREKVSQRETTYGGGDGVGVRSAHRCSWTGTRRSGRSGGR